MDSKNMISLVADPNQPHKPIADKIDSNTLVFVPSAGDFVMQTLSGRRPELYCGMSMDHMEQACTCIRSIDVKTFKATHESTPLPSFTTGQFNTDLNDLFSYRRKDGNLTGVGSSRQGRWNTHRRWETVDDAEDEDMDEG